MRLSRKQLDVIKDIHKVDELWSFSKLSTFGTCSWAFKLKYIDKIRTGLDNVYSYFGTIAHDITQDYDSEKYTSHEEMSEAFEEKLSEWELEENPLVQFNSDKERDGYIENLRHYFRNVKKDQVNVLNEKPVVAVFNGRDKYVFQGYIDAEYIDNDGNFVILDYKTSSISGFSGAQLLEKAQQLMIYAWGVHLFGRKVKGSKEKQRFPLDKIKLRYDMMKYCEIDFIQKNGKPKTMKAERRQWVAKLSNQIRKDFESVEKDIEALIRKQGQVTRKMNAKVRTEEEKAELKIQLDDLIEQQKALEENVHDMFDVDEMMEYAIENNTVENLPKFIQDKYTVRDCYIDIQLNEDIMNEFIASLVRQLDTITEKMSHEDPDSSFARERVTQGNSFFCNMLCDLKSQCEYYKEYQDHQEMFMKAEEMSDDEVMEELGLL